MSFEKKSTFEPVVVEAEADVANATGARTRPTVAVRARIAVRRRVVTGVVFFQAAYRDFSPP